MKKLTIQLTGIILVIVSFAGLAGTPTAFGQETAIDKLSVPLSNPSRPVFLKVGILNGSISVKGVSSLKEVVVEASTRFQERKRERVVQESSGLRRIQNSSTGLSIEEEDNEVSVSTSGYSGSRTIDLSIQVPAATSMKLSTVNDGDIYVENVVGDLEISNTNGKVTLENISGSAVAHALNGNIVATFPKVNQQKPMSFSSLNGKIDVTLPPDIKATLFMRTDQGEIYTDFDMQLDRASVKTEEGKEKRGKYRVSFERGMKGTINGGGTEIQAKNFNGDIYIRKGK
ncbi:MAG: DUF4097 family beta strand repeat-containing protein [Bacteroidota bacterium]